MQIVTLVDGRQVNSSSREWMAECEARTILAMPLPKRDSFWQDIERKRGADAVRELKLRCLDIEPHYVLGLPNVQQRRDYLANVERRFGPNPRQALEAKLLALHHARQGVATATAN